MLATKQSTAIDVQRVAAPRELSQTSTRAHQQRRQLTWRDKLSITACIGACVAAGWFIAATGAKIDQLNYTIDRMQTDVQRTTAENASLSSQVDELMRPARILSIALSRLHMQYANPVDIPAQGR